MKSKKRFQLKKTPWFTSSYEGITKQLFAEVVASHADVLTGSSRNHSYPTRG